MDRGTTVASRSMGWRNRSRAQEVIMIAQRERDEAIGVLTNDATWRQSYGNGHMTTLNRGGRWYSDGEMVPYARRNWSQGGYGG
jgi:penicillin V acylase-like amidase (Ntn superfamily)